VVAYALPQKQELEPHLLAKALKQRRQRVSKSVTLRKLATLTPKPIATPMVKPMEERVEVRGARLELRLWP